MLVISCPDGPGIIAAISNFMFQNRANIINSDQHTTHATPRRFHMRIEFELEDATAIDILRATFPAVAEPFEMHFQMMPADVRMKIAAFVSKESHCLQELMWQIEAGDIAADITTIISNHEALGKLAETAGIPFHFIPVTSGSKKEAESAQLALTSGVDLIVLAKYMQILSPGFIDQAGVSIINIHHSFLPAFAGARPYSQAYDRGVKLIGATAHYVTQDLDEGPIIEQGVERVDHRATVLDLRRIGRHVERSVFARAVKWHTERRVFLDGARTVVFT